MYTKMQNENEKVFPSEAMIEEAYEKSIREQAIPFSELPTDVFFHMYNVEPLRLKDGRTLYFAEFAAEYDEHDQYYIAWIPKSLLKKFLRLEAEECWMVKNKGKRYISNNIERTYWTTTVEPIDAEFILSRIS